MVHPKVLVTYNTGGNSVKRPDYYDCFFALQSPPETMILPNHDRSPAKGRNDLVKAARELKRTHILLTDDDVKFKPDSLMKLLSHDKDIVTGLYVEKGWPHRPLLFDRVEEDGALWSYLLDPPALKEFENAGLGFVLIKMEVFDKVEQPWFRLGEIDCEQWCDDIGFFNRVTAAGFKIYCDMTVCCGHIGTVLFTPEWDEKEQKWYTTYVSGPGTTSIRIPQQIPIEEYKFVEETPEKG